jgi:hypothetical protein
MPWPSDFAHSYPPLTDLLFYDRAAGLGEFYVTNLYDPSTFRIYDPGNPSWLSTYDGWRPSWTHIVPLLRRPAVIGQ